LSLASLIVWKRGKPICFGVSPQKLVKSILTIFKKEEEVRILQIFKFPMISVRRNSLFKNSKAQI